MDAAPPLAARFACSYGGEIARGRRRLAALLIGLAALMLALSVGAWLASRKGPALLSLAVGLVAWTSWRMSRDLDPLWLEVEAERLVLQLRRKRLVVPLLAPAARRLGADEIRHLERLASRAGIVAGTGGFDSHLLGEFNLYASDLARAVFVDSGESRLVVTPDDPDGLVRSLTPPAAGG